MTKSGLVELSWHVSNVCLHLLMCHDHHIVSELTANGKQIENQGQSRRNERKLLVTHEIYQYDV